MTLRFPVPDTEKGSGRGFGTSVLRQTSPVFASRVFRFSFAVLSYLQRYSLWLMYTVRYALLPEGTFLLNPFIYRLSPHGGRNRLRSAPARKGINVSPRSRAHAEFPLTAR